ncbi:EthD domain-containing protein [Streptomyces sp. NBC_00145]|uniref:EthD domain-containing protein n=1 Tax=Streptomyces sp. NBC_00145 TaxID=2975666 RepID=UPI002E16EE80
MDHYTQVHVPLGVGLLWKHYQVKPVGITLQAETFGVDRTAASSAYAVITTMLFQSRADAECFIDLFERPQEAAMLVSDWPNFTDENPVVVMGSSTPMAVEAVIGQSTSVIQSALQSAAVR